MISSLWIVSIAVRCVLRLFCQSTCLFFFVPFSVFIYHLIPRLFLFSLVWLRYRFLFVFSLSSCCGCSGYHHLLMHVVHALSLFFSLSQFLVCCLTILLHYDPPVFHYMTMIPSLIPLSFPSYPTYLPAYLPILN